jgi:hypothetical protein
LNRPQTTELSTTELPFAMPLWKPFSVAAMTCCAVLLVHLKPKHPYPHRKPRLGELVLGTLGYGMDDFTLICFPPFRLGTKWWRAAVQQIRHGGKLFAWSDRPILWCPAWQRFVPSSNMKIVFVVYLFTAVFQTGELHLPFGQKMDVWNQYLDENSKGNPRCPKVSRTQFFRIWSTRCKMIKVCYLYIIFFSFTNSVTIHYLKRHTCKHPCRSELSTDLQYATPAWT